MNSNWLELDGSRLLLSRVELTVWEVIRDRYRPRSIASAYVQNVLCLLG